MSRAAFSHHSLAQSITQRSDPREIAHGRTPARRSALPVVPSRSVMDSNHLLRRAMEDPTTLTSRRRSRSVLLVRNPPHRAHSQRGSSSSTLKREAMWTNQRQRARGWGCSAPHHVPPMHAVHQGTVRDRECDPMHTIVSSPSYVRVADGQRGWSRGRRRSEIGSFGCGAGVAGGVDEGGGLRPDTPERAWRQWVKPPARPRPIASTVPSPVGQPPRTTTTAADAAVGRDILHIHNLRSARLHSESTRENTCQL